MQMWQYRTMKFRAPYFGILITLLQTLFVMSTSPRMEWNSVSASSASFGEVYETLFRADGFWYASIVDRGYVSTVPPTPQDKESSNVAFFPAYPLAARTIKALTGA